MYVCIYVYISDNPSFFFIFQNIFITHESFQMKRMKQIEQEKDVLLQGLAAVDKAREWYLKQISATQEKIKHLGRMGSHVVYKKYFLLSFILSRVLYKICTVIFNIGTMDRGTARTFRTATRARLGSESTSSCLDK